MASSAASRSWTKRWQTHAACPWPGTADTVSAPKGSLRTGPGPGRCLSCPARDGRLLRQCGALSANGGWCQRGNEPVTRFQSLVQFREQRSRSSSPGAAVPEQQSRSSSPGANPQENMPIDQLYLVLHKEHFHRKLALQADLRAASADGRSLSATGPAATQRKCLTTAAGVPIIPFLHC